MKMAMMAMMMIMMPFCASCRNGIPISPFFFVASRRRLFTVKARYIRPRCQLTSETTKANTMSMVDRMILVVTI